MLSERMDYVKTRSTTGTSSLPWHPCVACCPPSSTTLFCLAVSHYQFGFVSLIFAEAKTKFQRAIRDPPSFNPPHPQPFHNPRRIPAVLPATGHSPSEAVISTVLLYP